MVRHYNRPTSTQTPDPPLKSHWAAIEVREQPEGCLLIWETEVQPEAVEPFIRRSMAGALEQLERVLGSA